MTWALTRHGFTRRPLWIVMAVTWVALTGLLAAAIDDKWSTLVRLIAGAVYAVPLVALALAFALAVTFLVNLRNARRRLVPGATFLVTATDGGVTMSGPLDVRTTVPNTAWSMVRVRGDWVLMQQRGVPLISAWPRDLFSDDTLTKMKAQF